MLNANAVISPFSLMGSSIQSLEIKNPFVFLHGKIKDSYEIEIEHANIEHVKDHSLFFGTVSVSVIITVTETEVEQPQEGTISMILDGGFSAPDSLTREEFEELLKINGAAALYSIARSKIETITSAVFERGKLSLPVININKYYEEEEMQKGKKDSVRDK